MVRIVTALLRIDGFYDSGIGLKFGQKEIGVTEFIANLSQLKLDARGYDDSTR